MEPKKKMGRPSQGRSVRMQISVTEDMLHWLNQKAYQERKSISETVFLLLEKMQKGESLTFADNLRNGLDEQTHVPQVDSKTGRRK
jgi:hypothetical protein